MKYFISLQIILIPLFLFARQLRDSVAIIPQPVSIVQNGGWYTLSKNTVVEISAANVQVEAVARMFVDRAAPATGYIFPIKKRTLISSNSIRFMLDEKEFKLLRAEGYRLSVSAKGISVIASRPAGLFYGMQSLMQLFSPDIESKIKVNKKVWSLPIVEILDYPRFVWRGLMLDVARHFFDKEQVKHFIDDMVKYKFNLLHLHLTDDDGWRIEIKSLPLLTKIGAWRPEKTGNYTFFETPKDSEPNNYGGYFTQEDIKEIVEYAGKNFVNVLPEIDVPGHSLAAISAYNYLASTTGNFRPCSGDTVMIWPDNGDKFYARYDNSLCAGKEEVFDFLDKVFSEVATLFPFEYIHAGGDEGAMNFWEKSEDIKALMKREGLSNLTEVQNYFSRRVEKIINSRGKKMIGWDEILEGGLNPSTAIMSWRGTKGGIAASARKHEVVFSPSSYAYLNFMQGDKVCEPPVYKAKLLKTVYETEPLPEGVDPKYVKGVQGNLWSEQIYTYRHLQYMAWPRAFAIAELAWTPAKRKNYPEFIRRVEDHFNRYNFSQTKFSPGIYDPLFFVENGKDGILNVIMETQIDGLDLHYSFDNSFPDNFYPRYNGKTVVPKDATFLKVISYRNGKPIGRMITISIAELKNRLL
ncbi:MAG: family 20 glycosylhydrolase [Ginsengibacter sp.]